MSSYPLSPLAKKLGHKSGMRAMLIDAPIAVKKYFAKSPMEFPTKLMGEFDYLHIFATRKAVLKSDIASAKKHLVKDGMLWISWPKAKQLGTDLSDDVVRELGLAAGLVDVKVAAIDDTWSALRFVYRAKDR